MRRYATVLSARPRTRPASTALAVAALLVALAPTAVHAEEGELAWSVGAGFDSTLTLASHGTVARWTPRIGGGVRYALDDFWELGGALAVGVGLGGGPRAEPVFHLLAEARYVIDALQWVPYLCAGAGLLVRGDGPDAYAGPGSGPAFDATLHLGFGVEYRPSRDWSVGAVARYHLALPDPTRTVGPIDVFLSASFYYD